MSDNVAPGKQSGQESPEQIRKDIEQTRAGLSETLDEIQARLSPDRIRYEVTQAVRDNTIGKAERIMNDVSYTAQDTGNTMMDQIRQNPIPVAMVAVGLGWLFMNRKGSSYEHRMYQTQGRVYRTMEEAQHRTGRMADQAQFKASQVANQAQYKAAQLADQAQSTASNVAGEAQDKASQVADQAQQAVGEAGDQLQYQTLQAKNWFEEQLHTNPLAVGAAALAVGAVLGLSMPSTEMESQLMGEQAHQVMQQAQMKAQETMEKAKTVAEQTFEQTQETMKEEARNQGLTS